MYAGDLDLNRYKFDTNTCHFYANVHKKVKIRLIGEWIKALCGNRCDVGGGGDKVIIL